jgi:hypothetical protein
VGNVSYMYFIFQLLYGIVRLLVGARQDPRMRIWGDYEVNLGTRVEKSGTIAGMHVIRGLRG